MNDTKPLNAAPAIPILGQPIAVKAFFPTVLGVCNCEAQAPILLVATAVVDCPACGRRFQVQGVQFDLQAGKLHVNIGVILEKKGTAS